MSKLEEVFLPIRGYEGIYEVSNLGRVKSLSRFVEMPGKYQKPMLKPERILKQTKTKNGYLKVGFRKDSKRKEEYVHRLVGQHFLDNPENKRCINHKDGNKKNNHVSNLEWSTHQENNIHALQKGLRIPAVLLGEKSHRSKLTEKKVQEIRKRLRNGESGSQICVDYELESSTIYKIKTGHIWKHLLCEL